MVFIFLLANFFSTFLTESGFVEDYLSRLVSSGRGRLRSEVSFTTRTKFCITCALTLFQIFFHSLSSFFDLKQAWLVLDLHFPCKAIISSNQHN